MAYLSNPATKLDYGLVQIGSNIDVDILGIISIPQSVAVTADPTFNNLTITGQVTAAGPITAASITSLSDVIGAKVYDNAKRVVTNITPIAGTGIVISNLIGTGPSASFTVSATGTNTINTITVTSNYLATATDEYIGVNSTNTTSITLPAGVNGRTYIVTDEHGPGTGKIQIQPSNSEKINGAATYQMSLAYQSVTVVFNSGSWRII